MFAVIELQGHQYIVRPDDTIVVDKLELESSTFVADKVLLIAEEDGSSVTVGTPYVGGMSVTFDVVTDFQKGEKTRVVKFKRKNRYQRIIGFRPHETVLKVTTIGKGGVQKAQKVQSSLETAVESEEIVKTKVEKVVKEAKIEKEVKIEKVKAEPKAEKKPAVKKVATTEDKKPVAKKTKKEE